MEYCVDVSPDQLVSDILYDVYLRAENCLNRLENCLDRVSKTMSSIRSSFKYNGHLPWVSFGFERRKSFWVVFAEEFEGIDRRREVGRRNVPSLGDVRCKVGPLDQMHVLTHLVGA